MGIEADALRMFWMRDMHRLTGALRSGIREWLSKGQFIVTTVGNAETFTIRILDPQGALEALAADAARFASSAFETLLGARSRPKAPRSTAWLCIESYYASFFAAHAILRFFGQSCTQLDSPEISVLDRSVSSFNLFPPGVNGLTKGLYICRFNFPAQEIHFKKATGSSGGSHEAMWKTFASKLDSMGNEMVRTASTFKPMALKLWELKELMESDGHNGGSWFAQVRNQVNYRHGWGAWHPYHPGVATPEDLLQVLTSWSAPPLKVNLSSPKKSAIRAQVSGCALIASLLYCTVLDMETACPRGRSFQSQCSLSLVRQANPL